MDANILEQSLGIRWDSAAVLYEGGPIVVRLFGLSLMSFIAARLVKRAIRRIDDERTRRQLDFFAPKIVRVLVIAAGLEVAGIDITGMAAVLTTVGFTGAVVFTPLGQNMVAGLITTLDAMYEIGDVIEVEGVHGTVISRSLLRIELAMPDGTTAWVPNKALSETRTLNHTRLGGYRISVLIPLDHSPDRALATRVMNEVVAGFEWSAPNRPPFVCFEEVAGEATIFRVYAWITDRTTEPIYRSLMLTGLVERLEDVGLSVGHTTNLSMYAPGEHAPSGSGGHTLRSGLRS
ncbi:MAG: mechanosensitive ion channel family protein [Acidimicrobiales bacterium]